MNEYKLKQSTLKLIGLLFIVNTIVYITLETDMRFFANDYLYYFMNSIIDYVIAILVLSITYGICFQYFDLSKNIHTKKVLLTIIILVVVGFFLNLLRKEYRGGYMGGFAHSILSYLLDSLLRRALDDVIHFTITTLIVTALFVKRKPISLQP